ncbi:MAG: DUF2935 domain-containing protein [Eubacteriales bacterium]
MVAYTYSNAEENRFWLKILSLKSQVLYNSISPDKAEGPELKNFIRRFEELYKQAEPDTEKNELMAVNRSAYTATGEFRLLVLSLLRKQLTQNFYLSVKPSFVNHIVSMTEEYLYLLGYYLQGKQPRYDPLIQDIFWLPAFHVDARLFADNVEFFDTKVRYKSEDFDRRFLDFFDYAITLQGFLRTGLEEFPILSQYRHELRSLLDEFAVFTVDLLKLARANMLPGTITLVELEINYRILCYHSAQLAVLEGENKPACNPDSL